LYVNTGSVKADGARFVIVVGSVVEYGNIDVVGAKKFVSLSGNYVLHGDIKVEESNAVHVSGNEVNNGDMQVQRNDGSGPFGTNVVSGNNVRGGGLTVVNNQAVRVIRNNADEYIRCSKNDWLSQFGNATGGNLDCLD
jgi:hypothetical protein